MILPLAVVLCVAQDAVTTLAMNISLVLFTSTLIPVISFTVLFGLVLFVNPMLRFVFRGVILRPLNRGEFVCIFGPMLVTSGIATFGVTGQLVPLVAAPWNPNWNTAQAGWEEDLHPHLNARLYLTVPDDAPDEDKVHARAAIDAWLSEHGAANRDAADAARLLYALLGPVAASGDRATLDDFNRAIDVFGRAIESAPSYERAALGEAVAISRITVAHVMTMRDMQAFREGVSWRDDGTFLHKPVEDAGWRERRDYYGDVFGAIRWGVWIKPLALWLIFVAAAYGMFYFLTQLVIDYWSRREQLIFPLAALPESIMPAIDAPRGRVPVIFKTVGFWVGFTVSFLVMTWNVTVKAKWVVGIGAIKLGMSIQEINLMLKGAALESYQGFGAFVIVFTTVGLSFLLPTHVSFSAWVYFVVGQCILLLGAWWGYGATIADFPKDWFLEYNALTAMGGGGLMLFSAVSLYRCLRQNATEGRRRGRWRGWMNNLPVLGLFVSGLIMTLWLTMNWGGGTVTPDRLIGSLLVVMVLTLMTLGVMRIVAEGGIYWMQYVFGFTHIFKILGLGKLLGPAFLVSLAPVLYVLFMDIKTFAAPNMINAARLQREARADRLKYHLTLVTSLVVVSVISIGVALWLAHARGAGAMHDWWYIAGPKWAMERGMGMKIDAPEVDYVGTGWFGAGAGWVGLTMMLRRVLLWFPHPIGFLMFTNPLMTFLWFSILIGWIAKKLTVRYGGKETYDKVQPIFIGLIMGELIAICLWPTLGLCFDFDVSLIDLNRYSP